MAFFGTRIQELRLALTAKPRRHARATDALRVTPPGIVIAGFLEILVVVAVTGVLAKGVDVWVRLLVPERFVAMVVGSAWAFATGIAMNELHSSVRKHISIAQYLAPYFGHRIYRTYRAIRYGHS